jgi:probable HAF family extracellular repeat protein
MDRNMIGVLVVVVLPLTAMAQVEFRPLGDIPGGAHGSSAIAVSADGSFVAGWGYSALGEEAFRWTLSNGFAPLGDLPGGLSESQATAISGDGLVVVGYSVDALGPTGFIWSAAAGFRALASITGQIRTDIPAAVNHDGSIIVGQGFRWSSVDGWQAMPQFSVKSISPSGMIWVGDNDLGQPFRSVNGSITHLGNLPTASWSSARGVSSDGSVVVGYSAITSGGPVAFRWTSANGMIPLGNLDTTPGASFARGVSADGRIVVGDGTLNLRNTAFIWTPDLGMRDLRGYLQQLGVQGLEQWHLGSAAAISSDGTTIVGNAFGPNGWEGYRVRVPCNANLIASQPTDAQASIGDDLALTVTANEATATFRWKRDGVPLVDSERISGTGSGTLLVHGLTASDQGTLTCLVEGSCGSVETTPALLTCRPQVTDASPLDITVVAGAVIQLQCTLDTSGTTTLRWRRDGQPLFNSPLYSGVTTATLTINATDPTLSGLYTLTATNPCGSTVSTGTNLAVLCLSDRNFDGGVDGDDIIAFFAEWEAGNETADLNADGGIDFFDVEAFFEQWENGC